MTDLAALLDRYPDLSAPERAAVDARVAGRPEWAEAHREARAFAAVLDAAGPSATGDDIARAAVDCRMGCAAPGAGGAHRDDRPHLGDELERVAARLDELEAGMAEPSDRFEALTGVSLPSSVATGGEPAPRALPSSPRAPERSGGRRWSSPAHWVTGAAVLAIVYGVLFAVSTLSATPREQVAALGEVRVEEASVPHGSHSVTERETLGPALGAVRQSRRSVLGLFPHYDDAALDAAAADLAAVVEGAEPGSWESQEARLALGRVYLYRACDVQAARVLGGLVAEGSYRAGTARRLIDFLRA